MNHEKIACALFLAGAMVQGIQAMSSMCDDGYDNVETDVGYTSDSPDDERFPGDGLDE